MRTFMIALPVVLLACGGGDSDPDSDIDSDTDADPGPQGQVEGAIVDYGYGFDVWTRQATATLTIEPDNAGHCMDFAYDAEPPTSCLWNGVQGSCAVEGSTLTVCGVGVEVGAPLVVETAFEVPDSNYGDTDIGYQTQEYGADSLHYMVTWFGGCSLVGPCDEDPATFATFHWEISHRPGEQLLCPGVITQGETLSSCAFEGEGGPVYSSMGFAVSSLWERTELGSVSGVDVAWYDLPTDQSARLDVEATRAFMTWAEDLLGPYPYGDELRFFSAPTYWGGFEHPGNISIHSGLRETPNSYRNNPLLHTVVHEIGHMWAGNQTTLASYRDFVWKEATVEYLAFVFEEINGEGQINADYWKYASQYSQHYPVPVEDLEPIEYYGDAYGPGPMIIYRQIEALYGRDAVLDALPLFLGEQSVASVDDIRAALESTTGADLQVYFDTWLVGEGKPRWPTVSAVVINDDLVVSLDTVDSEVWPCAFHVRLSDNGDITDVPVRFEVGSEALTLTIPLNGATSSVAPVVDPFSEALVYGASARVAEIDPSEIVPPHPLPVLRSGRRE